MRYSINWLRIKTIKSALPGATLLLVVALSLYTFTFGRAMLRDSRAFPAVSHFSVEKIWVALGPGFPDQIVRQYDDGIALLNVINMAGMDVATRVSVKAHFSYQLHNGERVSITVDDGKAVDFKVEWMSAAQRMTLGIPLHPDKMSREDWEALPGIGVKLAARIESDRHKNGVFGSLRGVKRVKGIGNVRVESWMKYF